MSRKILVYSVLVLPIVFDDAYKSNCLGRLKKSARSLFNLRANSDICSSVNGCLPVFPASTSSAIASANIRASRCRILNLSVNAK